MLSMGHDIVLIDTCQPHGACILQGICYIAVTA